MECCSTAAPSVMGSGPQPVMETAKPMVGLGRWGSCRGKGSMPLRAAQWSSPKRARPMDMPTIVSHALRESRRVRSVVRTLDKRRATLWIFQLDSEIQLLRLLRNCGSASAILLSMFSLLFTDSNSSCGTLQHMLLYTSYRIIFYRRHNKCLRLRYLVRHSDTSPYCYFPL
jgi:hypothetical protein